MSKRRILGVIPIRSGSKGIKNKNIQDFNGHPLFTRALSALTACGGCDTVIISTESEQYAALGRQYGAYIPFLRPENLADDGTRLHYVLAHALKKFDELGQHFDAVLSVQATAPLLRPCTLSKMITIFHSSGCDAVGTASEIQKGHPYLARTFNSESLESREFLRLPNDVHRYPRQCRPQLFYFNGAAFLRDRSLLDIIDDESNCLGSSPKMVLIDDVEGLNIDTYIDLKVARILAGEGFM